MTIAKISSTPYTVVLTRLTLKITTNLTKFIINRLPIGISGQEPLTPTKSIQSHTAKLLRLKSIVVYFRQTTQLSPSIIPPRPNSIFLDINSPVLAQRNSFSSLQKTYFSRINIQTQHSISPNIPFIIARSSETVRSTRYLYHLLINRQFSWNLNITTMT